MRPKERPHILQFIFAHSPPRVRPPSPFRGGGRGSPQAGEGPRRRAAPGSAGRVAAAPPRGRRSVGYYALLPAPEPSLRGPARGPGGGDFPGFPPFSSKRPSTFLEWKLAGDRIVECNRRGVIFSCRRACPHKERRRTRKGTRAARSLAIYLHSAFAR